LSSVDEHIPEIGQLATFSSMLSGIIRDLFDHALRSQDSPVGRNRKRTIRRHCLVADGHKDPNRRSIANMIPLQPVVAADAEFFACHS
jgi:hypothetical protein